MNKRNLAFGKTNFIMIAAGMLVVIIGFLLMISPANTETHFSEDMFSTRCITVAPVMSFIGFVFMIAGVVYTPRKERDAAEEENTNLTKDNKADELD